MAINISKSYQAPSLNLAEHEHRLIELSLHRNKGNRKETATELGIHERTLYRRLRDLNLAGFPSTWAKKFD